LKKSILYVLLTVISIVFFCNGCSNQQQGKDIGGYYVLYSGFTEKKSYLYHLDLNGKVINRIGFSGAGIRRFAYAGNKIYLPSYGTPEDADDKVYVYNIDERNITKFTTGYGTSYITVGEEEILCLVQDKMNSGKLKLFNDKNFSLIGQLDIQGVLRVVYPTQDKYFLYAENIIERKHNLYVINRDLVVEKTIPISEGGYGNDILETKDKIYVSNISNPDFSSPGKTITVVNKSTLQASSITLSNEAPSELHLNQNTIYVAHYNFPTDTGNSISIINLINDQIKTIDLDLTLYRTHIYDNKFFVLSGNKLGVYELDTLNKTNEITLPEEKYNIIPRDFLKI
jgi:hypothetical protein